MFLEEWTWLRDKVSERLDSRTRVRHASLPGAFGSPCTCTVCGGVSRSTLPPEYEAVAENLRLCEEELIRTQDAVKKAKSEVRVLHEKLTDAQGKAVMDTPSLIDVESEKFYHADGSFELLLPDEVKRRRIACAGVVEAAVGVKKIFDDDSTPSEEACALAHLTEALSRLHKVEGTGK